MGARETPPFKFLRQRDSSKTIIRTYFRVHELGTLAKNGMDPWLWDRLD
jgi:hypothetical protein